MPEAVYELASPQTYAEIATSWNPGAAAFILWVFVAYLVVIGPVRVRFRLGEPASPRRVALFSAGLFAGFLAEASPLHLISEVYLFSGHMLQHILLTLVMPPLLILGTPEWCFRFLTKRWVLPIARALTSPIPALAIFNAAYTLWHLQALYQAALYNHNIHILEHIVMVGTAFLMWWPLTSPLPELPRISEAAQVVYVFFMAAAQIGVFAVVTFAYEVFYPFYGAAPRIWGITPHQDQQLAGIVMKLGGMLVFLYVLTRAFFGWVRKEEAAARARREAQARIGHEARSS